MGNRLWKEIAKDYKARSEKAEAERDEINGALIAEHELRVSISRRLEEAEAVVGAVREAIETGASDFKLRAILDRTDSAEGDDAYERTLGTIPDAPCCPSSAASAEPTSEDSKGGDDV